MKTRITIELVIEHKIAGSAADAVDAVLDVGVLQDTINESCSDDDVLSAIVTETEAL